MTYKEINKELRIYSCKVADLTGRQVAAILSAWEDDAPIGSLTAFYDKEKNAIVLNEEHKHFWECLDIIKAMLEAPEAKLSSILENAPAGTEETVRFVIDCMGYRKAIKEVNILRWQGLSCFCDSEEGRIIEMINKQYEGALLWSFIYNYGFIQGKRAERARKRKVAPVQQ